MTASLGTITIELQLTTKVGGPISLADIDVAVPVSVDSSPAGATLKLDEALLRHEIANALIEAAQVIDAGR